MTETTDKKALIVLGCPEVPVQNALAVYTAYQLKASGYSFLIAGNPAVMKLLMTSDPERHYIGAMTSLEKAVDEERATYTKIKNRILEKQKIGAWFYGHFHMHNVDRTQETVYVLLDMFRPEAFAADIFPVKHVLPI